MQVAFPIKPLLENDNPVVIFVENITNSVIARTLFNKIFNKIGQVFMIKVPTYLGGYHGTPIDEMCMAVNKTAFYDNNCDVALNKKADEIGMIVLLATVVITLIFMVYNFLTVFMTFICGEFYTLVKYIIKHTIYWFGYWTYYSTGYGFSYLLVAMKKMLGSPTVSTMYGPPSVEIMVENKMPLPTVGEKFTQTSKKKNNKK